MTSSTRPRAPLTLCELTDPGIPGLESYSPFCLKVHRALRVAGLPYARRHEADPGSYRSLNPTGQVPILLVGDEPVADSTRILARIASLSDRPLDAALGAAAQAEALLWEELADTALNGFLVAARWADDRNWPRTRAAYFQAMPAPVRLVVPGLLRRRVISALSARDIWRAGPQACWERFSSLLEHLERRAPGPDGGFWLGRALSVADLSLFAQLHSLRTELTPWQQGEIARMRRLSLYLDRVDRETCAQAA